MTLVEPVIALDVRTSQQPRGLQAPVSGQELDGVALNEDGVALAFTEAHKENLRYCHHAQKWFVWTGSAWKREETALAFSWARQVCRKAAKRLEPTNRVKDVLARAATAAAVERYAKSDRAFAVTAATWNQNGWILGTPEGTVDLRTGKIRPSSRADHITKQTAVAPAEPGTPHPLWTTYLQQATGGDTELQSFLQSFAGYCLTGDVTEEKLAFFYGTGGTGKGTFISTAVGILADYAVSVPVEVFTAGSHLKLEYYRAQMAGARLVTASETEAGTVWAEAQIKEMTGNEAPLPAREPFGKPFNFKPSFKLLLVGNNAPRLKGRSEAMERRLRIVPFKVKPVVADLQLKARLQTEWPAILRWMIDGCMAWRRDGLGTCAAVAAETGTYFEQQDAFGRWLEERCILDGTLSTKPSALLADFLAWVRENGEASVTASEFRETVERTKGLKYVKSGTQWVRGVGVKPPAGYNDRRYPD